MHFTIFTAVSNIQFQTLNSLKFKVEGNVIMFTAWKVSKYGVFSGPNTGKYGTEKIPYLDTFRAVIAI